MNTNEIIMIIIIAVVIGLILNAIAGIRDYNGKLVKFWIWVTPYANIIWKILQSVDEDMQEEIEKEKIKIVHYLVDHEGDHTICARGYTYDRNYVYGTCYKSKVTCKQCLKELKKG